LMDVEIYFIYKNTIIEGGGEFLWETFTYDGLGSRYLTYIEIGEKWVKNAKICADVIFVILEYIISAGIGIGRGFTFECLSFTLDLGHTV
jgi:hypothetical protein